MPTVLFVHFHQCRKWQAKTMHTIQCCFPRYAVDNIARHYPRIINAREEKGDAMLYLFDVIADSQAVCVHIKNELPVLPFIERIIEASNALKIPVWYVDNHQTIYSPCQQSPKSSITSLSDRWSS